jgi:hypothetical protein
VERHDRADTGADRRLERHQFDRIEARTRGGHRREGEVRVGLGVTMSGEMLAGRQHPVFLDAAHHRRPEPSRQHGILTEGPRPNHRVGGIVVDVEHRTECHVDA